MFVVICHEELNGMGIAICLKATSQTEIYENNKEMMAGVVYYKANELAFFNSNTAIQPDNPHPIPHAQLAACLQKGILDILGNMPEDFSIRLANAINASVTISSERKQNFLKRLNS
jgi:hypothetical protein